MLPSSLPPVLFPFSYLSLRRGSLHFLDSPVTLTVTLTCVSLSSLILSLLFTVQCHLHSFPSSLSLPLPVTIVLPPSFPRSCITPLPLSDIFSSPSLVSSSFYSALHLVLFNIMFMINFPFLPSYPPSLLPFLFPSFLPSFLPPPSYHFTLPNVFLLSFPAPTPSSSPASFSVTACRSCSGFLVLGR